MFRALFLHLRRHPAANALIINCLSIAISRAAHGMSLSTQVLSPAEVAEKEPILLPWAHDSGPLPVRFVPVHHLFDSPSDLQGAARRLRKRKFLISLRSRGAALGNGPDTARESSGKPAYLAVAIHANATSQDLLAASLAACVARRELLSGGGVVPRADGKMGSMIETGTSCRCDTWWDAEGRVTDSVNRTVESAAWFGAREVRKVQTALEKEGWMCEAFALSQQERTRFRLVS
jgi:hypothetical protein